MRLVQETTARVAMERARATAARPPPLAESSFVSGGCAASGGRDDSGASLTGPSYRTGQVWQAQGSRNEHDRTDPAYQLVIFQSWRPGELACAWASSRAAAGLPGRNSSTLSHTLTTRWVSWLRSARPADAARSESAPATPRSTSTSPG